MPMTLCGQVGHSINMKYVSFLSHMATHTFTLVHHVSENGGVGGFLMHVDQYQKHLIIVFLFIISILFNLILLAGLAI